ncbi:MAG TPA: TIGR01459 family HAD-type hydrolase [Hyphomicrobiaceae bacterium]|nr:TIGR01459 family HAD-type hydrolase [Hyphomicrobiaceae bacterium]
MTDPIARDIPILASISELAATSDAWLVDIWGVMHNGVSPIASTVEACAAFRERGGYVVLVTNAPRPAPAVVAQLAKVGVDTKSYDAIVTSGDVTRGLVEAWAGKPLHHLGPDRDRSIFAGLDANLTTSLEAEIVVCSGFIDDETETPDDYRTTLKGFLRRDMLMLCANPDFQVERGDRLVYCAGALAQSYEALGGRVIYSGKPHLPIYELAFGIINNALGREIGRDRLLAIGDGVRTDIAGAATAGVRSVFIGSGIHLPRGQEMDGAVFEKLFENFPTGLPVAAMTALRW